MQKCKLEDKWNCCQLYFDEVDNRGEKCNNIRKTFCRYYNCEVE